MVTKRCTGCKRIKAVHLFNKNGQRPYSKCKACYKRLNKDRRQYERAKHYKKTYGLSLSDVDNLLTSQNRCCKLCLSELNKYVIDHCHDTGNIRGILCFSCNTGIGHLKENPALLVRAAEYVKTVGQLPKDL